MHLTLNLVCWVSLIWSYGWMLNDEDLNGEEMDQMFLDMAKLCPDQNMCGKTKVNDGQITHPENSCCQGCSCDRNCSESRYCCWGDDDDSLTTCLQPTTEKINLLLNFYVFVSKPPSDGCKQGHDGHVTGNECKDIQGQGHEGNVACSSDEMAAPWGNFYPVYSRSLDKNFKNAACARCHGAEDIECWSSVYYSDFLLDFEGLLADFNEKNILMNSNIVFQPPNKESSSFDKLCFIETDTCPSSTLRTFYVPSYIEMDRESIANACEKGPKEIYLERPGGAFKNVFCAICNGFTHKYSDKLRCETTLDDSRTLNPPLRILLDAGYFGSIGQRKSLGDNEDFHKECYKPKHTMNESICKELNCPSLQIRLQTGQCGYAAKIVSFDHLALCLNISTEDGLEQDHDDVMNMTGSQIVSLLEENSPWSKTFWKILAIGVRLKKRRGLELLVCLTWTSQTLNLNVLSKQIKISLHKSWKINLTRKMYFYQEISKHGSIMTAGDGPEYINTIWLSFHANAKYQSLIPPIWKRKYLTDGSILFKAFYVDQMFLCEQIEISPDEYELESPGGVLYLNRTQSFLYPGQYTHLMADDGSWRVRVCLKDASEYVKVVRGTGTRPGKFGHFLFSFSFCLYLLIDTEY